MGTIKQNFANNVETGGTFDAQDLTGTIPAANIANSSLSDITTVPPTASGGDLIQSVASDPPAPDFGDIWYNSTEQKIKLKTLGAGSWATGGNLNTGRRTMGGAGIQTAALGFGGWEFLPSPPYSLFHTLTESYNGSSWTEVNDLNTARGFAGSGGTQTSALFFGGDTFPPTYAVTESWNGTSWSEVNDLNTARFKLQGAAADNTSSIAFGGNSGAVTGVTESWNGTSWTEVNDLNTAREGLAGFGIATSAIAATGATPPGTTRTNVTESWNGTSWTTVNNTNRTGDGAGAAGADNTAGLIFGGHEGPPVDARTNITESWNGTSWTEEADLSGIGYHLQAGAGTATAAISFGGEGPANEMRTGTEEWTVATPNQSIQGS